LSYEMGSVEDGQSSVGCPLATETALQYPGVADPATRDLLRLPRKPQENP
jgi:hypothetical protein